MSHFAVLVIDSALFKRIKKYKLYNDNELSIINDMRKQNRFVYLCPKHKNYGIYNRNWRT